ncbi:aldehyde dehydrogenase family protein [Devosia riboflavina]|nr:aldehyde dehydrogenase family protein [Devosia riboflavina]
MVDRFGVKPGRLWIGGAWTDVDERFDQIHPATNEIVTSIADAGTGAVDLAVAAARKAFDTGPWPRMGAKERKKILVRLQARIEDAKEELGYLQTLDNGIPINFSLNSRVSANMTVDIFDHYAGWIDKITGETFPRYTDAANLHYMTFRDPVGVVGAIIPWNAPLVMFALKVAPALATGCTIVMKASELANLAVLRLAEIVAECDLPPGVFNLVTGGPATGEALSTHPGVDKVSFTGSAAVGERIMAKAGSNMKRLSLELGGKSAVIVFPDTRDLKVAATSIMSLSSTFLSGQVCSTPTRALVHRSVVDEFVAHAQQQISAVKFGDPFDMTTTSAPIISRRQTDRVMSYIETGSAEGARLVFGGDRPGNELADGNWINPTLFTDVRSDMRIAQDEIFGPVLSVIPFDTEEEAITIANDSVYGLSGGVYTTDLSRAFRVGRAMHTGTVGINGYSLMPNSPAGGVKRSGIGREGGWATIEAFTELKTLILNLDA